MRGHCLTHLSTKDDGILGACANPLLLTLTPPRMLNNKFRSTNTRKSSFKRARLLEKGPGHLSNQELWGGCWGGAGIIK